MVVAVLMLATDGLAVAVGRRGHRVVQQVTTESRPRPRSTSSATNITVAGRASGIWTKSRLVPGLLGTPARRRRRGRASRIGRSARGRSVRPVERAARLPPPMKSCGPPLVGAGVMRVDRAASATSSPSQEFEQHRQLLSARAPRPRRLETEVRRTPLVGDRRRGRTTTRPRLMMSSTAMSSASRTGS